MYTLMAVASGFEPDLEKVVHSESIKRWLEQSKSLRILITGKTGVGKSALVNGIVGKYVAKEGDTPNPETLKVTEYRTTIQDVEVIIYDSPGLQDGIDNEEAYLKDMEGRCKEVDLNLYCTKMTEPMDKGDYSAISKLSNAFGMNSFWQNTLFVLTFANKVKLPSHRGSSTQSQLPLEEYFEQQLVRWKEKLQQALYDEGVKREVANKVPVIPAGYHRNPSLPAANCEYWLSNVWFQCLERTADVAKPALLKINWERLRTSQEVKKEDISKLEAYHQPIVLNSNAVPPFILRLLGLSSELTEAGRIGGQYGGVLGHQLAGNMGMNIGEITGAMIGEVISKFRSLMTAASNLLPQTTPSFSESASVGK